VAGIARDGCGLSELDRQEPPQLPLKSECRGQRGVGVMAPRADPDNLERVSQFSDNLPSRRGYQHDASPASPRADSDRESFDTRGRFESDDAVDIESQDRALLRDVHDDAKGSSPRWRSRICRTVIGSLPVIVR